MEETNEIVRNQLLTLLVQWQTGVINEREAHERAEALFNQVGEQPDYPESDPRSILLEVLVNLDSLNYQLITPDDIPAIQAFLHTRSGNELEGWAMWRNYWDNLDLENRRQRLRANPYYSTTLPS